MKTRKSTLELTPLLDVVLIILFVFMILLANSINEGIQTKNEAQETAEQMQGDLDAALENASELEDGLAALEEEIDRLELSGSLTTEQLEKQREISDEQQQTAENLAKAVAEFIGTNQDGIESLLDENSAPTEQMLSSMSTEGIAEELLKYEAISRQFYFIDLELKTENNRLYINGESTSVGISNGEAGSEEKLDEIKEIIENDLEQRQGGSQMVFISLIVKDRQVRQYAWQTVWDAIGEIQEKYGTDKVYRTHITLIED